MMKPNLSDINPTTRMFPRTLQEAFPKDYINDVFEGPYRDPQQSDFAMLMALIAVVTLAVFVWRFV